MIKFIVQPINEYFVLSLKYFISLRVLENQCMVKSFSWNSVLVSKLLFFLIFEDKFYHKICNKAVHVIH